MKAETGPTYMCCPCRPFSGVSIGSQFSVGTVPLSHLACFVLVTRVEISDLHMEGRFVSLTVSIGEIRGGTAWGEGTNGGVRGLQKIGSCQKHSLGGGGRTNDAR
jgi:hypothetical protein